MIKIGPIPGRKRLATAAALAASSLLLTAFAPAAGASAATHPVAGARTASRPQVATPSWQVQTPPAPSGSHNSNLSGVSCSAPSDCLAVGGSENNVNGPNPAFADSWNGSTWTLLSIPDIPDSSLNAVSCVSATYCLAVGGEIPATDPDVTRTLAEVWNGSTWTTQTTINPSGTQYADLTGVSCTSATKCTAVGWYSRNRKRQFLLAEHWDGSVWRTQTTPAPTGATKSEFNAVSCASATSCVAVGNILAPTNDMVAEGWNGTRWTLQSTPDPSGGSDSDLLGVSCPAATACTATGGYLLGNDQVSLAEFWDGTSWAQQSTPNPAGAVASALDGVSCRSADMCVAAGGATGEVTTNNLAEIWNGSTWTLGEPPAPSGAENSSLDAVSCHTVVSCSAVGSWAPNETTAVTPVADQYS